VKYILKTPSSFIKIITFQVKFISYAGSKVSQTHRKWRKLGSSDSSNWPVKPLAKDCPLTLVWIMDFQSQSENTSNI